MLRSIVYLRCALLSLIVVSAVSVSQEAPPAAPQPSISAVPESQILPPPHGYHFPNGETRVYSAEWHFLNAGTATVSMDALGSQQRVVATADTQGIVNGIYKVHDRYESLLDPKTFCSQLLVKHVEEGSHKRDTKIHFDYARRKNALDETNLKTNQSKHEENDIPSCVTDIISAFYYAAALPLEPGSTFTFDVNDGGKTARIRAQVEARDKVKVPAGTYQAVRVKAEALSGPLQGKGNVLVWFSDDPNHIPVQMKSKLGWGSLMFRLEKVEKRN